MRNLILDPLVLIPLVGIFIAYFLVLLRLSKIEGIAYIMAQITIVSFLVLLIKPIIPPLNYLQPDALAGIDKTAASAILQLAIYTFFIVLSRSLFHDFFKSLLFIFKDPFLGTLLVISVASPLWSETPLVAFRFSIVQFFVSLFAAQIARKSDWITLEKYLRLMCLIAAILSIFTILAIPSIGIGVEETPPFAVRWMGIFPFPIKLGTCMALSITLWIHHFIDQPKHRLIALGVLALSFLLLIRAISAQAFFTLIVLLGFMTLLNLIKKFSLKQTMVIAAVIIVLFIVIYLIITANLEAILGAFGKDATLTGRTEFWPQMLDALKKQPVLGYGVQGFWQPWRGKENPAGYIIAARGFIPPNGHNGFLDLALEVGYTGLALFLLSLIFNFARAVAFWKRSQSNVSIFPLIIILYVIMSNISETQLFVTNYIWFSYVLVAVRLNMKSSDSIPSSSKRN